MSPNPVVHLVMFGWIPAVLVLFAVMRGHRAVATAFLIAWLFLPMYGYPMAGMPDYTKVSATTVGVLLAVLIFDGTRLLTFRPKLFDLPMLVWCLVPMASSISNGLGFRDGLSDMVNQLITWGLPYLLGRIYFNSLPALRDLALAVVIGGMLYVPLCLFEIKMSPQLHAWVYGYHQHDFGQTLRFGGWRPTVFMQHGLAVGTYMAAAGLAAVWLWMSRSSKKVAGVPIGLAMAAVIVTAVLCKSLFAVALMMAGIGAFVLIRTFKLRVGVVAMLMVPLAYITARTLGGWSAQGLLDAAYAVGHSQGESIWTRVRAENILWEKAAQRPIFGWGGWGRNRVIDLESGRDIAVSDGLWIIFAGKYGMVGLAAFWAAMIVGPIRFLAATKAREWKHPAMAGAVVMTTLLAIHMCDNLLNAMMNPLFVLAAGGLVGVRISRAAPVRVGRNAVAGPSHMTPRGAAAGLSS